MEARVLLDGHARVGSWMAIAVHLKNDGPPIDGRAAAGRRRRRAGPGSGRPVDLPTQSDKTLPPVRPAAGLRARARGRARRRRTGRSPRPRSTFTVHDATQLVVGVVAERPSGIVGAPRPAAEPEPARAGHRAARPGGPAGARRGLGRARPPGLAGHRLEPPRRPGSSPRCAAGSPAAVGSSSSAGRPARRRCRLPRRHPALPADGHDRRPGRHASRAARRAPGGRDRPAGAVGELIDGRVARDGRRSRRRGRARLRQRRRDAPRLRSRRRLDRRDRGVAETSGGGCSRRARRRGSSLGDDSQLVQRRLAAAGARPAADRRAARPARRLHPAHRPDQLPRPAPARPARVGVGHDADPDRALRRRRVRLRRRSCAAAT